MLSPALGEVNPISVMRRGNPVNEEPVSLYHLCWEAFLFRGDRRPVDSIRRLVRRQGARKSRRPRYSLFCRSNRFPEEKAPARGIEAFSSSGSMIRRPGKGRGQRLPKSSRSRESMKSVNADIPSSSSGLTSPRGSPSWGATSSLPAGFPSLSRWMPALSSTVSLA